MEVPGAHLTFVGRATERTLLDGTIDSVARGSTAVLFLEGEAGIGKTRLVDEALPTASARGFSVAHGECERSLGEYPFAPLVRAFGPLRPDALQLDDGQRGTPTAQYRTLEAIRGLVDSLAADGPLIVALEDLHWADPATLDAWAALARRTTGLPVLLLATLRSGHGRPDLHRTVDDSVRGGARHVMLGPLEESAVADLAGQVLGADPGSALRERLAGAGGNPLFVIEYSRSLQDDGSVQVVDGVAEISGGGMPASFAQAVLRRLAQLSPDAVAAVRTGAVLGAAFSVDDLSLALGRPVAELAAVVQESVDANVLAARGDRLTFVHDLAREAVYSNVPGAVRKAFHREIARALAAAGREPIAVAHHMELAAEPPDAEAADWLRRAARDVAFRAPGIAVELFERARELAPAVDPAREELPADLVLPLAWSGRLTEAEALARQVLERAPRPEVAGPLRCGLVYSLAWQARPGEALKYAEPAAGEELRAGDALLLRAYAAVARMFAFDLRGAAAEADAVEASAEAAGHDLAMCTALGVKSFLAAFAGDTHRGVELGRRAVAVADRTRGGEGHLAAPRFFVALPLIALDLIPEAEDGLRAGRSIAEELGHVWCLPLYDAYLGTIRFVTGDWDDAVAQFEASLELADEIGIRMITFVAVVAWLAVLVLHRGDMERAEELLALADRRVAQAGPQIGMSLLAWARALVKEARGETEEALSVLQAAWDFSVAAGLQAEPWSGAELVRMLARAGRPERATPIAEVIEAQGERIQTPFMRARARHARGLAESDAEAVTQAVELYRQSPRPHELALACEDAATLLGRAKQDERAVPLLQEAIETYERLGATRDASRARAALRALGVSPSRRAAKDRPTRGWESLTPTELEVARLVAQRLSNPEVAQRLFVSRHTVESHLKHIYAKLGVSSRVQLAADAARQGPSVLRIRRADTGA